MENVHVLEDSKEMLKTNVYLKYVLRIVTIIQFQILVSVMLDIIWVKFLVIVRKCQIVHNIVSLMLEFVSVMKIILWIKIKLLVFIVIKLVIKFGQELLVFVLLGMLEQLMENVLRKSFHRNQLTLLNPLSQSILSNQLTLLNPLNLLNKLAKKTNITMAQYAYVRQVMY